MRIFREDNDVYKVMRITGPSHTFLKIEASSEKELEPTISASDSQGRNDTNNSDEILRAILEGVAASNRLNSAHVSVGQVEYLLEDKSSPDVYRLMAEALVSWMLDH